MTHRIHRFPDHSMRSLRLALFAFIFAIPSATSAEELGRLFFTPERRQQLDHQRQFNPEEQREASEDPTLTINGVVTRSSGKRTVWVNGVPQEDSGVLVSAKRSNPSKVIVDTNDVPATQVSVGNTLNRDTGETADILGSGKILITSPARAQ
ncbi:hypothetical protein [Propionivibrio sp.]|uniref:hypothetical protein n=1 Tax=Propionivibrio sp. TaxID=2212460 RepID=UPI00272DE0D5|nr:hypothetical protein [Propionivibrio sp.]